ncbi:hypothetical protein FRB99_007698 [Tulasnella sp. 403]|nr:hypothetical protein FRB99_007698 [Tulasnella sp. 403]
MALSETAVKGEHTASDMHYENHEQEGRTEAPPTEQESYMTDLKVLPPQFYEPYLSELARTFGPNPIRKYIPMSRTLGMLSVFAGSPAPTTFPFKSLSMTIYSGDRKTETTLQLRGDELDEGLQYSDTSGLVKFVDWLYGWQERSHRRKRGEGWKLSVGSGSQDLLHKAFSCLINPGDAVLLEAPVYAGIIPLITTLGARIIEVATDGRGIVPESLETILRHWPEGKPLPKFLYTIPYGCNPTGATVPAERRRKVLKLAQEYNILILEDDPYYYLYFGDNPRPPSYFQLEAEVGEPVGRVIRFDSFSKILSAGMRLGLVSGPERIVDMIDLYTASSNLQPSSFSQSIALALFQHWGYEGFDAHIDHIAMVYRQKCELFEAAMREHLTGLAEWTTPEAGMFVWFKLLLPERVESKEGDSEQLITNRAIKDQVIALPGTTFFPLGRKTSYVRASFSVLEEQHFPELMKRLAKLVREARTEETS